ncbi:MAG: holo-ACP synthase [Capsulimonadales bacterium]|nr:holo-ACP synthase [Capsulimonadales bacterium]
MSPAPAYPGVLPGNALAIGVDLVDVDRVRDVLARYSDRFARKVLSEAEAAYCFSRPDPAPHIAARFAAKESVIKCLGGGCSLNEIEIVRALTGFPSVRLHGRASVRANGRAVLISLSHLDHMAVAFAVLTDTPAV